MAERALLESFLVRAEIEHAVYELRPDYRALLLAVDGVVPAPSDEASRTLLEEAEAAARQTLADMPVDQLPHIAGWREAYRACGAKPQRTRNSLEALTRRAAGTGLPRVNRLADLYNAISVLHQVPLGGEDRDCYAGPPRLVRATGEEPFDTVVEGETVIEHPEPGEVVWRDDEGVTCRRWNWRQGPRTQLTDHTTTALFIFDALGPMTDSQLTTAADHLAEHLTRFGEDVQVSRRLMTPASLPGRTKESHPC